MAKDFDIASYLQSGVLEAYVMGALSEEESREVTGLLKLHPELEAEVAAIEHAMVAAGSAFATREPGMDILENALAQIDRESATSEEKTEEKTEEATMIALPGEATVSRPVWPTWLAIAASVLLLVSVGTNYYLYQQWQQTDSELIALQTQSNQVLAETEALRTRLAISENVLAAANLPNSQTIRLAGLDLAPEGQAIISWDTESGQIALMQLDLPIPATEFQYQLWAIIDGQPVDAGVLTASGPQMMKRIQGQPAAFAITLEQAGGSPIPTLNRMYVYRALAG
jgi:anti-sigma-K factor RskA